MVTDTISDILTRIRNATAVNHKTVILPYCFVSRRISEILLQEGFIESIRILETSQLILYLKYKNISSYDRLKLTKPQYKISVIRGLKRISKPGIRVYVPSKKIPVMLQGMGVYIISTSQGIMTDKEARFHSLGGELLCSIW